VRTTEIKQKRTEENDVMIILANCQYNGLNQLKRLWYYLL